MTFLFLNATVASKEQLLLLPSKFSLSSYCDINTFCCSQYWPYKKGIPSKLYDRHREFVLRCLEGRKIALGSDLSGITCQGKDFF